MSERANGLRYWFRITWKGRVARFIIACKKFRKRLHYQKKPNIDDMQATAVELFMVSLKNKNSSLNYSPESKARFIVSDYMWITMSSAGDNNYLINIIDESEANHAHSHEVYIPKEYAFELMDEFDVELERKFRLMEAAKKQVVVDDLDKLIFKIQAKK